MKPEDLEALFQPPPEVTLEDLFKPLDRPNVSEVDFDGYEDPFPNRSRELKCGDCGGRMQLISVPKFKRPFYGCARYPECKGTLGAHKDGSPLGRPTDQAGREARKRAHAAFDQIWKDKVLDRSKCYEWMQTAMGLPKSEAHIAMLTREQCERLIELVHRDFSGTQDALSQIFYEDDGDDQDFY